MNKMKGKSVSEKINELLKPKLGSEDERDEEVNETAARIVDFGQDEYDLPDVRSTDFRKKNVKLLSDQSARYKGKITSRKELRSESDDSEADDDEDSDSENDKVSSELRNENNSEVDTDIDNSGNENESGEESEELDDQDSDENDEDQEETAADVISEKNRQAEIQKGFCVQNQLRIWERLLEIRIRTQKVVANANQLPTPEESNRADFTSDVAKDTAEKTCLLLKSLLDLKIAFSSQFSELRSQAGEHLVENSVLNDYVSGGQPPLKRIAVQLENQHNGFRSYRNAVLLKWDDRTKLLKPGGAKRKINEEFDIIRKIDNALLNRDALIAKSRILQNENTANEANDEAAEKPEVQNCNPNLYEDSDFYHQQLRELIEFKASSSANLSEVAKQLSELQKIRQKMKKKVDTRASKGRKIRYVVHNKLINFMAPDDSGSSNWTNESKDELYKSLFAT